MLGIGEINKEGLKMLGFRYQGKSIWQISFSDTFNTITVSIENPLEPHVSIECLNDSMHVPNAYALSDLSALITLFEKYKF